MFYVISQEEWSNPFFLVVTVFAIGACVVLWKTILLVGLISIKVLKCGNLDGIEVKRKTIHRPSTMIYEATRERIFLVKIGVTYSSLVRLT